MGGKDSSREGEMMGGKNGKGRMIRWLEEWMGEIWK